jgi:hypothetical protein
VEPWREAEAGREQLLRENPDVSRDRRRGAGGRRDPDRPTVPWRGVAARRGINDHTWRLDGALRWCGVEVRVVLALCVAYGVWGRAKMKD